MPRRFCELSFYSTASCSKLPLEFEVWELQAASFKAASPHVLLNPSVHVRAHASLCAALTGCTSCKDVAVMCFFPFLASVVPGPVGGLNLFHLVPTADVGGSL